MSTETVADRDSDGRPAVFLLTNRRMRRRIGLVELRTDARGGHWSVKNIELSTVNNIETEPAGRCLSPSITE